MENFKKHSKEYFDLLESKLNTAVICDILDEFGYRNQAMMGKIAPLDDSYKLIGKAKTILSHDVYEMPDRPYESEIEAVDSIADGDVVVVCTNNSTSNGFWGELLATAAIARGGRGVIVDGAVRDILQLKELAGEFKTFTAGRNPLDSKGRCLVDEYDCPIMCDGGLVHKDDIIFADIDGIVVIPTEIEDNVVEKCLEKVQGENIVRKELKQGARLKDVFEKYKIL